MKNIFSQIALATVAFSGTLHAHPGHPGHEEWPFGEIEWGSAALATLAVIALVMTARHFSKQ